MSVFTTLQTLFGGPANNLSQPQNQPGQQGQQVLQPPSGSNTPGQPLPGTQSSPQTAPNGSVPAGAGDPPNPLSSLDNFKETWKAPEVDPNKQSTSLFANLDPAKVMESAKGVDFTKSLTPEVLAKISGGGQEAVAALLQTLNTVGQGVYGQGAIATTKIVEQALERQRQQFEAALPNLVRQATVADNLQTSHPAMSNPAVQPVVQALQKMYGEKNPTATSQEVAKYVNDYFGAIAAAFAPQQKETPQSKKASQESDFSHFLNG